MRIFLFFIFSSLFAAEFDSAVIGSSPVALFEAIYRHCSGERVAIFEKSEECGGAWKAIDACGVFHADLGCHLIGQDRTMGEFLRVYGGCKLVTMDPPFDEYNGKNGGSNGYYFSGGCNELIRNLLHLIDRFQIPLYLQEPVLSVGIDERQNCAVLQLTNRQVSTEKIVFSQGVSFATPGENKAASPMSKYYHLYLLIADPEPPKFSYRYHGKLGITRAMNLTYFAGMVNTGRHLVVLQVRGEDCFANGTEFVESLKKEQLLSPSAYLISSESHIYEQPHQQTAWINHLPNEHKFRFITLSTSAFGSMNSYISKWKEALIPYKELE